MEAVADEGTNANAGGADPVGEKAKPVCGCGATSEFKGITVEKVREKQREKQPWVTKDSAAFNRVKNLVWIKENTFYEECLKDRERSLKLFTERVDRREKRIEDLTSQVFNLVGFFCVFQGVILTAVTQLSSTLTAGLGQPQQGRPLCGKVWFPVFLSAVATVVTIVSLLLKFTHLYSLDVSIQDEKASQTAAFYSIESLLGDGKDYIFPELKLKQKGKDSSTHWVVKCTAVVGALFAFTVLLILSYFVILCDKWVIVGWN